MIQDLACGESGVLMRLLLVKDAEDSDLHTVENDEGISHGTSILTYFCLPWAILNVEFMLIHILLQSQVYRLERELGSDSLELSRLP